MLRSLWILPVVLGLCVSPAQAQPSSSSSSSSPPPSAAQAAPPSPAVGGAFIEELDRVLRLDAWLRAEAEQERKSRTAVWLLVGLELSLAGASGVLAAYVEDERVRHLNFATAVFGGLTGIALLAQQIAYGTVAEERYESFVATRTAGMSDDAFARFEHEWRLRASSARRRRVVTAVAGFGTCVAGSSMLGAAYAVDESNGLGASLWGWGIVGLVLGCTLGPLSLFKSREEIDVAYYDDGLRPMTEDEDRLLSAPPAAVTVQLTGFGLTGTF